MGPMNDGSGNVAALEPQADPDRVSRCVVRSRPAELYCACTGLIPNKASINSNTPKVLSKNFIIDLVFLITDLLQAQLSLAHQLLITEFMPFDVRKFNVNFNSFESLQ